MANRPVPDDSSPIQRRSTPISDLADGAGSAVFSVGRERMSTIEPDELAAADRTVRTTLVIAIASAVLCVLGIVAGLTTDLPAAAGAVLCTGLLFTAIASVAGSVHSRMIRSVGRLHPWRRERSDVAAVGSGRYRRIQLRIDSSFVVFEPVDGISNSDKLIGQTELDIAGKQSGQILVRIPGDTTIRIFAPRN